MWSINFDVFFAFWKEKWSRQQNRAWIMDLKSVQNNGHEITCLHCSFNETRSKFMKETELGQVVTID